MKDYLVTAELSFVVTVDDDPETNPPVEVGGDIEMLKQAWADIASEWAAEGHLPKTITVEEM